jgi:hypothetical protein
MKAISTKATRWPLVRSKMVFNRRQRLSSRRHSPSRAQRANNVYSVPNGMSHSWSMARHCMPQKQTHQIAITALRRAAPAIGRFGPGRVSRVPAAAMAPSSASTSSTKASHEAGEVFAVLTAVPMCYWFGGYDDSLGMEAHDEWVTL